MIVFNIMETNEKKVLKCEYCEKTYKNLKLLRQHLRKIHFISKHKKHEYYFRCCESSCDAVFSCNSKLISHLETVHAKYFEIMYTDMKTLIEFNAWKSEVEEEYKVRYIRKAKALRTTYFRCNRNRDFKRNPNKTYQPSIKMLSNCTSQIKLLENEDGYTIIWVKTHYGHGENAKRVADIIDLTESDIEETKPVVDTIDSTESNIEETKPPVIFLNPISLMDLIRQSISHELIDRTQSNEEIKPESIITTPVFEKQHLENYFANVHRRLIEAPELDSVDIDDMVESLEHIDKILCKYAPKKTDINDHNDYNRMCYANVKKTNRKFDFRIYNPEKTKVLTVEPVSFAFRDTYEEHNYFKKDSINSAKEKHHICCEPSCDQSFHLKDVFIKHLEEAHGKVMDVVDFKLKNRTEFETWKASMEDQNNARYTRTHVRGNTSVYLCSRNKMHHQKRDVDNPTYRRKLKTQGYSVMDINCTSHIKFIENENDCTVHWIKTHYGHEEKPEHVRLTKNQRNLIINCLKRGIKPTRIVEFMRNLDKESSNRLQIITAKKIGGIKKYFKIDQVNTIDNVEEDYAIFTELYNEFLNPSVRLNEPIEIIYETGSTFRKNNLIIILQNMIQKLKTFKTDKISHDIIKIVCEVVIELDKMLTENTENLETAISTLLNVIAHTYSSLSESKNAKPRKKHIKNEIKETKTISETEDVKYILLEAPNFSNLEYQNFNNESDNCGIMYQNVMECDEMLSEHDETMSISSEAEIKPKNNNSKEVFKRKTSAECKQKQKNKIRKSKHDVNKFLDVVPKKTDMPNLLLKSPNFSKSEYLQTDPIFKYTSAASIPCVSEVKVVTDNAIADQDVTKYNRILTLNGDILISTTNHNKTIIPITTQVNIKMHSDESDRIVNSIISEQGKCEQNNEIQNVKKIVSKQNDMPNLLLDM